MSKNPSQEQKPVVRQCTARSLIVKLTWNDSYQEKPEETPKATCSSATWSTRKMKRVYMVRRQILPAWYTLRSERTNYQARDGIWNTFGEDGKYSGIEIASHNSAVAGLIAFPRRIAESNVEDYWFYTPPFDCCLEFPSIATGCTSSFSAPCSTAFHPWFHNMTRH